MHTADTDTAVLTPSSPLLPGETYTVVATTLVLAANNSAPMASQYACTFDTQRVLFERLKLHNCSTSCFRRREVCRNRFSQLTTLPARPLPFPR